MHMCTCVVYICTVHYLFFGGESFLKSGGRNNTQEKDFFSTSQLLSFILLFCCSFRDCSMESSLIALSCSVFASYSIAMQLSSCQLIKYVLFRD